MIVVFGSLLNYGNLMVMVWKERGIHTLTTMHHRKKAGSGNKICILYLEGDQYES
jgi:hypothetical protein